MKLLINKNYTKKLTEMLIIVKILSLNINYGNQNDGVEYEFIDKKLQENVRFIYPGNFPGIENPRCNKKEFIDFFEEII